MVKVKAFAWVALVGGLAVAAPPGIRFPDPPVIPDVMPAPPVPGVQTLREDTLYVVDSDIPVIVIGSPPGTLSITEEPGPLRVRGKFIDGRGVAETRTYKGKQVFVIEGTKPGRAEVIVIPVGFKSTADIGRRAVDVDLGTSPQPPPDPAPGPKYDKVWVIVVEEAGVPRTLDTAKALNDPWWLTLQPKHEFRHYLSDAKAAIDNGYVKVAAGVGYPAVLIFPPEGGKPVRSFKLTSAAQVMTAVKEVTK